MVLFEGTNECFKFKFYGLVHKGTVSILLWYCLEFLRILAVILTFIIFHFKYSEIDPIAISHGNCSFVTAGGFEI